MKASVEPGEGCPAGEWHWPPLDWPGKVAPYSYPDEFAFGRGGHLVKVFGQVHGGRVGVRLMAGPGKGSSYSLPVDELIWPAVQPPPLVNPPTPLPHDRWDTMQPSEFKDDPESEVCPHAVSKENGGWTYDLDLGLWVHGAPQCRRPSRSQLRHVTSADAGIRWS